MFTSRRNTIPGFNPASVHDVHYLKEVKELFSNCIIIGDTEYIGRQHQINLFETAGIELEVPLRINQKEQKLTMWILKKVRKRIETFFSQLCDQFMIQRITPNHLLALDPEYWQR